MDDSHRPATSLFAAALLPLIREMAPRYDFCRGTEREREDISASPPLSRHALRNETTAAEVATFIGQENLLSPRSRSARICELRFS